MHANDSVIWFGALAALVFAGWVWFLLTLATTIPLPTGALYARHCGTEIDGVWRTVPLSTIIVYPDRLEIEAGATYRLSFGSISAAALRRNVLIRGIFIQHHAVAVPSVIVIYTTDRKRLLALLQNQVHIRNGPCAGMT
jgi:hypothetical protein